jgi:hypothetical protein
MKTTQGYLPLTTLLGLLCVCVGGCVAEGGGYDRGYGGVSVGYGVEFYEPYGFDYGPSRPYRFGPPPRGYERPGPSSPQPSHPAYRPALPSRPIPSIPSLPRSPPPGRDGRPGR